MEMATTEAMEHSWFMPIMTILIVLGVQALFWLPTLLSPAVSDTTRREPLRDSNVISASSGNFEPKHAEKLPGRENYSNEFDQTSSSLNETKTRETITQRNNANANDRKEASDIADYEDKNLLKMNNQWRCACEGGFLPPGLLKSFGNAQAVMRLGTGQCYHKQM